MDGQLYPFRSRYLDTPDGRLHYLDEGTGPCVLLLHGTPTWSFLYRDLVAELARDHRVVAPDHLGFGMSDKPPDAPYRPRDHAERLTGLIDALGLDDFTLVAHDFGGPIGLAHAVERPGSVRALVLMNTWMWPLRGTPAARASRLFSTAVGRFLYTRLNFSARVLLRAAFADRAKLTPAVHRHYLAPLDAPSRRVAPWVLARELRASSDWFAELWRRRNALEGTPTVLLWGMQDPLLGPDFLARWKEALPAARVVEYPDAGHFVAEEVEAARLAREVRRVSGPYTKPALSPPARAPASPD